MAKRATRYIERLEQGARQLGLLKEGWTVKVQNMVWPLPKSLGNTGTVVEVCIYDQLLVELFSSRRLVFRNRQLFLMERRWG